MENSQGFQKALNRYLPSMAWLEELTPKVKDFNINSKSLEFEIFFFEATQRQVLESDWTGYFNDKNIKQNDIINAKYYVEAFVIFEEKICGKIFKKKHILDLKSNYPKIRIIRSEITNHGMFKTTDKLFSLHSIKEFDTTNHLYQITAKNLTVEKEKIIDWLKNTHIFIYSQDQCKTIKLESPNNTNNNENPQIVEQVFKPLHENPQIVKQVFKPLHENPQIVEQVFESIRKDVRILHQTIKLIRKDLQISKWIFEALIKDPRIRDCIFVSIRTDVRICKWIYEALGKESRIDKWISEVLRKNFQNRNFVDLIIESIKNEDPRIINPICKSLHEDPQSINLLFETLHNDPKIRDCIFEILHEAPQIGYPIIESIHEDPQIIEKKFFALLELFRIAAENKPQSETAQNLLTKIKNTVENYPEFLIFSNKFEALWGLYLCKTSLLELADTHGFYVLSYSSTVNTYSNYHLKIATEYKTAFQFSYAKNQKRLEHAFTPFSAAGTIALLILKKTDQRFFNLPKPLIKQIHKMQMPLMIHNMKAPHIDPSSHFYSILNENTEKTPITLECSFKPNCKYVVEVSPNTKYIEILYIFKEKYGFQTIKIDMLKIKRNDKDVSLNDTLEDVTSSDTFHIDIQDRW